MRALHQRFYFLGGTRLRWPHHPPLNFSQGLTANRVKHFQESNQPFLQAADVSPHPEAFSALTSTSWTRPHGPGLMPRAQVLWAGGHSCSVLSPELLGISWSIYKLPVTHPLWLSAFTGAICHFRGQNIIFWGKNPSNFTHFLIIHILRSHPFLPPIHLCF